MLGHIGSLKYVVHTTNAGTYWQLEICSLNHQFTYEVLICCTSVHLIHSLMCSYSRLAVEVVDIATGETIPLSPGVTFLITAKMSAPPGTYPHNVKYILMYVVHTLSTLQSMRVGENACRMLPAMSVQRYVKNCIGVFYISKKCRHTFESWSTTGLLLGF